VFPVLPFGHAVLEAKKTDVNDTLGIIHVGILFNQSPHERLLFA
jgi:hypothetical protein